jgi:NADH-quinone oxidoreductase subunit L
MTIAHYLVGTMLTPAIAALLIALFCRQRPKVAMALSVGAAFAVCVFAVLAVLLAGGETYRASMEWMTIGTFSIELGFLFDGTSAAMLAMVALVGFLIHVFSIGYMRDDVSPARFFGGLSIFMCSMLGIVLADNLIMIFLFWELVGFSSYMLIGHYLTKPDAAAAAKKAFIVNRIGDLGFVVGIVYAYWHFGTVNLTAMSEVLAVHPELLSTTIAALLMCGFIGKSAQFPLHVWLPDAMAGPTPASALIHAATMVAAGGYFLIRITYLFPQSVLTFILWLGVGLALYAGICAYAQKDIKRVLAYSTLSQLGYVSAAFGLGFSSLALFHLITHAFFKALLFLCAGSVIHGCHHEQNMYRMGGLLKRMPITSVTFFIGILALIGVYGLSGYYSKDAILIAGGFVSPVAMVLLTFGAFLTAGYMGRLYWVAFLGEPKSENAANAHEGPLSMTLPLIALAILSILGGHIGLWPQQLTAYVGKGLENLKTMEGYDVLYTQIFIAGTLAWVLGLVGAFFFYGKGASTDRLEERGRPLYLLIEGRLWFDEIYDYYVAKVQQRFAELLAFLDVFLLKGLVLRGSAGLVGVLGIFSRRLHDGNLHGFVYWFLAGTLFMLVLALGWLNFS